MLTPLNAENAEDEEDAGGNAEELLELGEVNDLAEVDPPTALNRLFAHGFDELLGHVGLIIGGLLELGVGDEQGGQSGVPFLDLQRGHDRVVGLEVAQPIEPEDPPQDGEVHEEEEHSNVARHA